MFTIALFYAYVPWSERALIPHVNNIIITEWNVYLRALYISRAYNAESKGIIFFAKL